MIYQSGVDIIYVVHQFVCSNVDICTHLYMWTCLCIFIYTCTVHIKEILGYHYPEDPPSKGLVQFWWWTPSFDGQFPICHGIHLLRKCWNGPATTCHCLQVNRERLFAFECCWQLTLSASRGSFATGDVFKIGGCHVITSLEDDNYCGWASEIQITSW